MSAFSDPPAARESAVARHSASACMTCTGHGLNGVGPAPTCAALTDFQTRSAQP
jgi:hypothetical protein